jgi:hypothetical protein
VRPRGARGVTGGGPPHVWGGGGPPPPKLSEPMIKLLDLSRDEIIEASRIVPALHNNRVLDPDNYQKTNKQYAALQMLQQKSAAALAKIQKQFEALPEKDRRASDLANQFLLLAEIQELLCDEHGAMQMYREFCGLPKDSKDNSVFETWKLTGPLVTTNGQSGWGPLHPRAPEAYFNFLALYEVQNSSQFTQERCWEYYRLFYTWSIAFSPDHKPHPCFNKYWPKVKDLGEKSPREWPKDINKAAPLARPFPGNPREK